MVSVTQRIKATKQPRGGYLSPKSFHVTKITDDEKTSDLASENISSALVGLAVDYLTRALISEEVSEAFRISLKGARLIGEEDHAESLIEIIENLISEGPEKIKILRSEAIIAACQLAGYDVCYRAGSAYYNPVQNIFPDENTIENIRIMVERGLVFFQKYGPVVKDGFTFEGGYSEMVNTGDGDFITSDTLWDFKVSKSEPTSAHTLQLLMYYIMAYRSKHKYLHEIIHLGIFNPRLNKVYLKPVSEIPPHIIMAVEDDVICY